MITQFSACPLTFVLDIRGLFFNTCVWISLKGHEHFRFYISPSEINTGIGVWFGVLCILFRGVLVLL